MGEAISRARDSKDVRAVVICGNGTSFCGGGDLADLVSVERTVFEDRDRIRRLHLWFRELVKSREARDRCSPGTGIWRRLQPGAGL